MSGFTVNTVVQKPKSHKGLLFQAVQAKSKRAIASVYGPHVWFSSWSAETWALLGHLEAKLEKLCLEAFSLNPALSQCALWCCDV